MNTTEIVEKERSNSQCVFLYREGLFWKAYERSAFAFSSQFRKFKPTKKYLKALADDLVTIGFPSKSLTTIVPEEKVTILSSNEAMISLDQPIDETMFVNWKSEIPLTEFVVVKSVSMKFRGSPAKICLSGYCFLNGYESY